MKAGIVCLSNAKKKDYKDNLNTLVKTLEDMGVETVVSDYIFEREALVAGNVEEVSEAFMKLYKDPSIDFIFDISGGDLANSVLDYIDYEIIKNNPKLFFGYSDLTTVINAICERTKNPSVLYQIGNIIGENKDIQIKNVSEFFKAYKDNKDLKAMKDLEFFNMHCKLYRGESFSGTLVGGNIRCLLKLAGTKYFPETCGKVLLLEALSSEKANIIAFISQLNQIGAFKGVKGVILGTFTSYESNIDNPDICELFSKYAEGDFPIAKTEKIGHGKDSNAAVIGEYIRV
ncbi:MAG: LD-carboxypeptidase [Lachnospiraceae bacterium]|nr:LD-carboxypeptidase [Lachnospiraceae bacterium]